GRADGADPGTEGLRRGLLGGKPRGQFVDAVPVTLALPFGVDAPEETLAEVAQHPLDAGDLDHVDPDGNGPRSFRVEFGQIHVLLQTAIAFATDRLQPGVAPAVR